MIGCNFYICLEPMFHCFFSLRFSYLNYYHEGYVFSKLGYDVTHHLRLHVLCFLPGGLMLCI